MKRTFLTILTVFSFVSMGYGYEFAHLEYLFCNSQHSEANSQVMFILGSVGLLTVPGECDTTYTPLDYADIDNFHIKVNHEKIKTKYIALAPANVPSRFNQSSFKACVTAYGCNKNDCKYKLEFLQPEEDC